MSEKPDPFDEGKAAYSEDIGEDRNPYDLVDHKAAYLAWNDGWNEAAENDPLKDNEED